ncbi:hypothetical protein HDC29_003739 [Sphingopyxis sp. JAI108]|nr:hypothetical protein [Sphingopyxis sp. JAI108]
MIPGSRDLMAANPISRRLLHLLVNASTGTLTNALNKVNIYMIYRL